jgi:type IV pilus assembly protein PilQ
VNGAEIKMTMCIKARAARRLVAACAIATAVGGGLGLAAAPAEAVRLVGVSAQATGKTAAVLIESTEPVAYTVSRPEPLTVLVDLRNVSVADAANQVARKGPVAGVTLEQATSDDGRNMARVRVSLASPSAYKVRSARNVIRLDIETDVADAAAAAPVSAAPVMPAAPARDASDSTTTVAATLLEKVRATHTRTATTITLAGNGRLTPSSLTESDDQPRRLVLDFPNVSPTTAARTGVDGVFVNQVRVALNSRVPLVTRVVMEISRSAAYHVERTGPDGRDLAVVFEGQKAGTIMVAPPTATGASPEASGDKDEDTLTLVQAIANAASITPADPIAALNAPSPSPAPRAAAPPAREARLAPPVRRQQTPPTPPPAQPSAAQPPPATPPQQPASPPQNFSADVPNSGQKQYTGTPINFDFEDADLRAVLRVFTEVSGLNMIIDPQVQGRVNVLLKDVPWDQALDQILRSNKLGYTVEGNIIRIAPLAVLTAERKELAEYQTQQALVGELIVRTFPLSYSKAVELGPLLLKSTLSPRGQIQTDPRTNTLIIMDLPDRLQMAQSLIATLDRPEPQVEVEARVVQTTRDFARALGIQWGFNGRANSAIGNTTGLAFPNNGSIGGRVGTQGPTDPRAPGTTNNTATVVNLPAAAASSAIGLALGAINGAFNLDVALTALETTGKGRILSTPRLTTQNNKMAEVKQGVQFPVTTPAALGVPPTVTFKESVLSLQVTPQITAANTVIMVVVLTNNVVDRSIDPNNPSINTQSANTTVQVNDGATTVIGGIFVSTEASTNNRTPTLYRIPILKWLFQNNSLSDQSRELLIFITPKILRG